MISTHTKYFCDFILFFHLSDFEREKNFKIARFVQEVPTCSQTIKQLLIFLLS